MKIKILMPSFKRALHQTRGIKLNRYVIVFDTKDYYSANVEHEVFWEHEKRWDSGYSWFTLGINTAYRSEIMKDRGSPDKQYFFGLVKYFKDYYDGPIITWESGPIFINYRW